MKVIVFAIDNLYYKHKEGGIPFKRLCNIFLQIFKNVYEESFTNVDLTELEVNIDN